MANISVLGAGTWGTALAHMLCVNGNDVTVWSVIPAEIENLSATRKHPNLPGMILPDEMNFTTDLQEACTGRDIILSAVPSIFVRSTIRSALPFLPDGQIIVDVAKGIEDSTLMTMSQVIESELATRPELKNVKVVALSGPTHAEEVALDLPTAIVASCRDENAAVTVQNIFMNSNFRVYTNADTIGVELGGAVKNVIALACGIARGMGYGDNASAALITRGAAELMRLATACGGDVSTVAGLAGIGDLIVTCTSIHSRNFRCGRLIGQGKSRQEATAEVGQVVEGLNALPGVLALSVKYGVEMPICQTVDGMVSGKISPRQASDLLMNRQKKAEFRS